MRDIRILLLSLATGVVLCLGLYVWFADLGTFLAADEKRWQARVSSFTTSVAHGNLGGTYTTHHPGITLQWAGAPAVFSEDWAHRKIPLVSAHLVIILLIGYVARRLWHTPAALVLTGLLLFNPFLVGHGRVYAMNALLALFLLLWILLLLLWQKERTYRYLVFSAVAAALAILSKLPGMITIPFTLLFIAYNAWTKEKSFISSVSTLWRPTLVWLACFFISLPIFLPALFVEPIGIARSVISAIMDESFAETHAAGADYYVLTLLFFSTPIHILGLLTLTVQWRRIPRNERQHIVMFLLFIVAFVAMMTLGDKKGNRYILPAFLALDSISALVIVSLGRLVWTNKVNAVLFGLVCAALTYQVLTVVQLHPYNLSHVNPLTKSFFQEKRHGWGQGLDIAAQYLNSKQDATQRTVASYYPAEFSTYFDGNTVPLHEWDSEGVDYVVLYRAQLQRGPDAWETDVLEQFSDKTPEKVIMINGIEYAWIHKL